MKRMSSMIILAIVAMLGVEGCSPSGINVEFDNYEHDFGRIEEVAGPVSHTFTFSNNGSLPVVIEGVKSSCGCTSPTYDRQSVEPRGSGKVELRFNPDHFSGVIKKNATVVFSDGTLRDTVVLHIVADVVPRPLTVEQEFPMVLEEGLRVSRLHAPMGYVHHGTAVSDTLVFFNTGDRAVTLGVESITGSGLLKTDIPALVEPGRRAQAIVGYDFTGVDSVWGPVADRIFFTVNGMKSKLPINTNALAVDNFEATDRENAPKIRFNPGYIDFGETARGKLLSGKTTLFNVGKSPLVIRNVTSRKNTECDLAAGTVVEAGGKLEIDVSLRVPLDASGVVSGGVTVISNDPLRPQRELRVRAEVK